MKIPDRIKLIDYSIFSLIINKHDLLKVINYFSFSIASVIIGVNYSGVKYETSQILLISTILPIVYSINYLYHVSFDCMAKYLLCKITWIKDENKSNIFDGHSIMINIILIYLFCKNYYEYIGIKSHNTTAIVIAIIYTIFFCVHRFLYVVELCEEYDKDIRLHSFLRYKSYDHAHVFAATAIGLPFLMGQSLGIDHSTVGDFLLSSISTYLFFLFGWIIISQYKYKNNNFLGSYKFVVPTATYPIFILLYYFSFSNNIVSFYAVYFLLSVIFVHPLLILQTDSKWLNLINEKVILFIIFLVMILQKYFFIFDNSTTDTVKVIEHSSYGKTLLFAIVAFLFANRKDDDEIKKFIRLYPLFPYLLVQGIYGFLVLLNNNMSVLPINISSKLCSLSIHIDFVQNIYAIIYIATCMVVLYPEFIYQFEKYKTKSQQ